jgi:hypothetical protein
LYTGFDVDRLLRLVWQPDQADIGLGEEFVDVEMFLPFVAWEHRVEESELSRL